MNGSPPYRKTAVPKTAGIQRAPGTGGGRVAERPLEHVSPDQRWDGEQEGDPELVAEHRHTVSGVFVVRAMPGMLRRATISGVLRVLVMGVVTDSRSALVVLAQLRVLGVPGLSRGYDPMALMRLMISHMALSASV